ncbi:YbdD/YjiX family protein [Sphingobium sp. DC-2]|uniref:YbdD/YjiX family protein n=1 Tax=Sphingobium sp. DC-2 TaxID=1303256 RepID=UPI000560A7D2|nr:CstA-like transporter-associated (seleno)protein [Sphingobium sp. DC-2]
MSALLPRLKRIGAMMVGMPDYDTYLAHMRRHHPERTPMDRTQFFRERQEARYGGRNGGKCC